MEYTHNEFEGIGDESIYILFFQNMESKDSLKLRTGS